MCQRLSVSAYSALLSRPRKDGNPQFRLVQLGFICKPILLVLQIVNFFFLIMADEARPSSVVLVSFVELQSLTTTLEAAALRAFGMVKKKSQH